jgi:hypothetical protein
MQDRKQGLDVGSSVEYSGDMQSRRLPPRTGKSFFIGRSAFHAVRIMLGKFTSMVLFNTA